MVGNRRKSGGDGRGSSSRHAARTSHNFGGGTKVRKIFEAANSNRPFILVGFFVLFAMALIVRLVFLTMITADEYSQKAEDSRTAEITVEARRGTIYDRNGNVLACSVDATTIYAVPSEVTDAKGTATILAAILKKDASELEATLSDKSTSFCYISRKEKTDVAETVKNLDLDGIYFLEDSRREYPYGSVGGTVIGFVNVDGKGVSGLESEYDSILRGVDGVKRMELGVNSVPITSGEDKSVAAVDGQDIMVSIDIEMQAYLEQVLVQWKESLSAETEAVLMDAATGEIYAASSTPLLNPTDTSKIEEGSTELAIVSRSYEPGSIFKTVTALTALEAKTVDTEDEFDCPSELPADQYYVSDSHARGDVTYTFREIMQYSSNVGISLIAEKTGFQALYNNIIAWGLNDLTGVDYPGESSGYLLDFDQWAKIQGYSVSFGQGISVTPLQITRLYGAIVNKGVTVTPHFLIAYPQTGEKPTYESKQIIYSQETIDKVTSMLQTVVSEGTGTSAQIDGFEPAGKTGTAEIAADDGGYRTDIYNVSFTGYIPDSTSTFVCFTGAMNQPAEGNVSGMFADIMSFAIDRYKIVAKQSN